MRQFIQNHKTGRLGTEDVSKPKIALGPSYSRLRNESKFFDRKSIALLEKGDSLDVSDPLRFLAGSSIAFQYATGLIGDVSGKNVLDYGCGSAWLAVHLAKMGGMVYGFDISSKSIETGIRRTEVNGVAEKVKLQRMAAEELKYSDAFFDIVIGISILHHIDLRQGIRELSRIMKKGAKAVFLEPLGENILLNLVRDFVEFRIRRRRTRDEHPLLYKDLKILKPCFQTVQYREFQLLGGLERIIGYEKAKLLRLDSVDGWLLDRFPPLRRFCRLIVICLDK
jgi:ubiquinone/menaquinone biosynthesis C-methylase UbiE